jgi:hypothetical protein
MYSCRTSRWLNAPKCAAVLTELLAATAVAFATFGAGAPCSAQCPDWRARGTGLRINGPVYDSAVWDPDGAGPQAPMLVVVGNFTRAGGPDGTIVNNIAAWDGIQWHALGDGVGGRTGFDYYAVNTVEVYNGELIAGGHFETVGGAPANGIARWNGTSWAPLGAGIAGGEYPTVYDMTVLDGQLIVGGIFTTAGGQAASSIARWDGANWFALGAGVHGAIQGFPAAVFTLQDFGEAIFVGGVFTGAGGQGANCIARWNGSSWAGLGTGIDYVGGFPVVAALGIFGGSIVAGGEFNTAGGQIVLNIARWNGNTWSAMGSLTGGSNPYVGDFAMYNGELIATGAFAPGGGAATNIARWTGTSWQPLGSGVGRGGNALAVFNNELVVGGWFNRAGNAIVESLARWNGSTWLDMPGVLQSGEIFGVRTITPWAGSVVLGGLYRTSETGLAQYTEDIHAWDGRTLRHLGDANHIVHASAVAPAADGSSDLIVGGQFDAIDGVPFGYIARLNEAPGSSWQPMGAGLDDYVIGITRFNGSTYACGYFTASGSTPLSYIARFDGSAWQPLGTGPSSGPNSVTTCMKGYQSRPSIQTLVMGGFFTSAGGVLANHIASFNINTATQTTFWERMGAGFNEPVRAIEYHNGSIYAAGDFTASGSTPLGYIARWNGTAWEQVGGGLNGHVRAMTVSNGTLIVGGYFTTAGGATVNRLARWDGNQWTSVGGGVDHAVFALNRIGNEIHVGGEFTFARLGVLESPLWARFSEDGIPWFAGHPESAAVACRGTASFTVEPALGYGGLSYQWRKDGVSLALGPTGTGSRIVSNGVSLHVVNANETDEGAYECVLSNGCGATVSRPATLTVVGACPPCPPDFNSDGVLNSQDVFDFLTAFFGADATADFNRDAVINSQDFFDYLGAFFTGCA